MDRRRPPQLSLDLLRGFRVAARHLSFTRAAEELSITQSAISHEVKALEEQIGHALFVRLHRGLQLTPVGEELYRVADEALTHIDAFAERVVGVVETISVTTTTGLASLWLAPKLPRFNVAHPGIDVQVITSNDKPELERDRLDIAIRFVPPGSDIPDAERLMECRCFPVCTPALMSDPSRPIRTPADLSRHVRLDYETPRDGRRVSEWDFWFDAKKITRVSPSSTLRFPQYDHVVAAALEGTGVAMGEIPHLTQHLGSGVLCAPFGGGSVAHRGSYFIVRRPEVSARPAVEAFVAWLWEEVKREGEVAIAAPADRARSSARGNASRAGRRAKKT